MASVISIAIGVVGFVIAVIAVARAIVAEFDRLEYAGAGTTASSSVSFAILSKWPSTFADSDLGA